MNYDLIYNQVTTKKLHGRYITLQDIEPILVSLNTNNQLRIIGNSVLNKPIYGYKIGVGKNRILIWSQMHGNESTTTKALIDFICFLNSDATEAEHLLNHFTFFCIPMLNPDGALLYTRENANKIDLNRDFKNFSQPESRLLQAVFDDLEPDFCYNMHDQRTIFGAGNTGKPATVSFLAPSYNRERAFNAVRTKACIVINAVNRVLQRYIPNQIGRFDDGFNDNCVGDRFQSLGVPTILFEAGHFSGDYEREITRKFIFIALLSSFQAINENVIVDSIIEDYLYIPQNKVVFYDFVCKNVKINYDYIEKNINFASQYREELIDGKINFNSYIAQIDDLNGFFGHFELDAQGLLYQDDDDNIPKINSKTNFRLGDKIKIKNGLIKSS